MLGCLFNRAWQTYAHSMLCICDAGSTTLLLWKRTKEVDAYNSFVSLRMQCLHCKFFCCDGHVAVQAEACLCMNWRMGIIRILMFFCSCVFIVCLHHAGGDMRSLVLARDGNVGRHCIWWVYTFFRQKNKSYDIECANVCSSELDVHYYTQCWASAMHRLLLYFFL